SLFVYSGTILRVKNCDSRAVDGYRAWENAILERWTPPARGILHFLSGGPLLRVGCRVSRAVDTSPAWDSADLRRWTAAARGMAQVRVTGAPPRARFLRAR